MWQNIVEERLGTKLDDASDEFGLRVRVKRRKERIATGLPDVVSVKTEPDQGVYAKSVIPRGFYNVVAGSKSGDQSLLCESAKECGVLEDVFITGAIKPDITTVEMIPDVAELLV